MASREKYTPRRNNFTETYPFETAQEAWFWFIAAMEAKVDGARFSAGAGLLPRPCEPIDILKVVDGLYRNRRLLRAHLLVLRFYGRRRLPPDEHRITERRAFGLWTEALERIGEILESKKIIRPVFSQLFQWHKEALEFPVAAE
jgi:hypothetical protein